MSRDSWKAINKHVKAYLDYPIVEGVAINVITNLINSIASHLVEILHPSNKESLWPHAQDGHEHLYDAVTSSSAAGSSTPLTNAYRAYVSHAQRIESSYNTFYAHYWAGIICMMTNEESEARRHLEDAYRCGVLIMNDHRLQGKNEEDPQRQEWVAVADILHHIESPLGLGNGTNWAML
jgi:hypothetical protein